MLRYIECCRVEDPVDNFRMEVSVYKPVVTFGTQSQDDWYLHTICKLEFDDIQLLNEVYNAILEALKDSHYNKRESYSKVIAVGDTDIEILSKPVGEDRDFETDVVIRAMKDDDIVFIYAIQSIFPCNTFHKSISTMKLDLTIFNEDNNNV